MLIYQRSSNLILFECIEANNLKNVPEFTEEYILKNYKRDSLALNGRELNMLAMYLSSTMWSQFQSTI